MEILYSDSAGKIDYNNVVIRIPEKTFPVVPGLHIVILGQNDFLKNYVLTINYPRQIFSIKKPTKK